MSENRNVNQIVGQNDHELVLRGLEAVTKGISTMNDANLALWIAEKYKNDLKEVQWERLREVVLASDDTNLVYDFLKMDELNITLYEDYFIQKNDDKHLYQMAVEYGEKAIAKEMNGEYTYTILGPEVDISKIEKVIAKSQDDGLIIAFATNVKGADVVTLAKAIISHGNMDNMIEAAVVLEDSRTELLREIAAFGNPEKMYQAMRLLQAKSFLSEEDNEILNNGIMIANDVEYAIKYASDECQRQSELLQIFVADSGTAEQIYRFAKNVQWADVSYLEEAMIETENVVWMANFAADIPNAHKHKIWKAIKRTKTYRDLKKAKETIGFSRFFADK